MIDWQNFFLGILLWLGGSGFLLTLIGEGDLSSPDNATESQNRQILELEKLLATKEKELSEAYKQINNLEIQLEEKNQTYNQAKIDFETQQQNLQSLIASLENQIATKTTELNNAYTEIELWHQKVETISKQTDNQNKDNQAQIEILEKELKEKITALEQAKNNIKELEEELSQTYDELEQTQDELAKNRNEANNKIKELNDKYEELNNQLETLPTKLKSQWQEEIFNALQYLLVNYPIAKIIAKLKPNTSIKNFIPLLKPIDELLKQWQIETIGKPWEKSYFNSEIHYSDEEKIAPNEEVYIRLVGYKQGDKILSKAKVSRQLPKQNQNVD